MALHVTFNTRLWGREALADLSAQDRYVYVYLLTNELLPLCGAYQVAPKRIAYDTGLDLTRVTASMRRLHDAGLCHYDGAWVALPSKMLYHSTSPKISTAIDRQLAAVPGNVRNAVNALSA